MVTKKAPTPSKTKPMKKDPSQKATADEEGRMPIQLRLGIVFPVTRIQRYMKERGVAERVSVKAAIAVASTLECLCAEIMELAGDNLTTEGKYERIKPRHLTLAIRQDEELTEILGPETHIAMGGVIPYIEPEILETKRKRRTRSASMAEEGEEKDEDEGEEEGW